MTAACNASLEAMNQAYVRINDLLTFAGVCDGQDVRQQLLHVWKGQQLHQLLLQLSGWEAFVARD
jgi:hypothetical protein